MPSPTPFFTFPDGSAPRVERFIERTAVHESEYSPEEMRESLRSQPRYELEGTFVLFDGERDTLAPLAAAGPGAELLVPAWMHPSIPATATERLQGPPILAVAKPFVAGSTVSAYPYTSPVVFNPEAADVRIADVRVFGGTTLGTLPTGALAWRTTDRGCYPLVQCRLSEDSFSVTRQSGKVTTTKLVFTSDSVPEPVGVDVLNGTTAWPMMLAPDGAQKIVTDHSFRGFSYDGGNLRTYKPRFRKEQVSILLTLLTRADALRARRFLLHRRGRYGTFHWPDPRDGVRKLVRLASDTWEMRWHNSHTAQIALSLVLL